MSEALWEGRDPQHDLIDMHAMIVSDLAECDAPTYWMPSGRAYCALCARQAVHLQGDSPLDHEPTCPYRRAKAITDQGWATDPGDY